MARTLSITSPKGGVGKTTLALNLALGLAEQGIRTLLVDTDSQGGIGLSLLGTLSKQEGLVNLAQSESSPSPQQVVRTTRNDHLSLLPFGSYDVTSLLRWSDPAHQARVIDQISTELQDDYDLIIFDSPAGITGVSYTLLTKVDAVLAPLQTEPLAFRALPSLVTMLRALKEQGAKANLVGVVLTMVRFREEYSLAIAQDAWELLPPDLVFESYVPKDPVFVEASAKGVPVALLSRKRPPAASVFSSIASELQRRLDLDVPGQPDEPIPLLD